MSHPGHLFIEVHILCKEINKKSSESKEMCSGYTSIDHFIRVYFNGLWLRRVGGVVFLWPVVTSGGWCCILMACGYVGWVVLYL